MGLTDLHTLAVILVWAACYFKIIGPHQLYLNSRLVLEEKQYWRIITNFLYFGEKELDVLLHGFFLDHYARLLEENYFRRRKADFFYMFFFCGCSLTGSVLFSLMTREDANVVFLSNSMAFLSIYVWSKHYSHMEVTLFSIVTFPAAYLPWVLLGTSKLIGSDSFTEDILGIVTGHLYYFLEYVYPRMTGRRPLRTPLFIRDLFPDEEELVFVFIRDGELRMEPPPA